MSKQHEEKLKEDVAAGKRADEFMGNALFKTTKEAIRAELFIEFRKTKSKDSYARDEIWRKMQALDWIEMRFERISRDGRNAESTLIDKLKAKLQ